VRKEGRLDVVFLFRCLRRAPVVVEIFCGVKNRLARNKGLAERCVFLFHGGVVINCWEFDFVGSIWSLE
jgi:hypothetical protein